MITLRNGDTRLVVAPEFGCRWMRLEAGKVSLLVPVASLAALKKDPFFDGAYLMAPWCNRIPKGRFTFRGQRHALKPNFLDGSAIHGDVLARRWKILRRSATAFTAELDSRVGRAFNFPWPVMVRHGIRLTARGVSAWISVKNVGNEPCPAGIGFHPFFPRTIGGKTASLAIPPRKAVSLSKRIFDEGYVLRGGSVVLRYGTSRDITLKPGPNATELFVWAPKKFRGRPATFACVEPMTMRVGAFSRKSVPTLKSGETLRMSWEIRATTVVGAVTFYRTLTTRN